MKIILKKYITLVIIADMYSKDYVCLLREINSYVYNATVMN